MGDYKYSTFTHVHTKKITLKKKGFCWIDLIAARCLCVFKKCRSCCLFIYYMHKVHKLGHHASPKPSLFFSLSHGESVTSLTACQVTVKQKHTHTAVTAQMCWSVCIWNVGMRRWGRDIDDKFKNTLKWWKSTWDFCVQVQDKVI